MLAEKKKTTTLYQKLDRVGGLSSWNNLTPTVVMGAVMSMFRSNVYNLRLPFASAKYGRRPNRASDWELAPGTLSLGRSTAELARGMQRANFQHSKW